MTRSRLSAGGVEVAGNKPKFQRLQGVQRRPSAAHGAPASLGGVVHPLQRDQGVDAADRLQMACGRPGRILGAVAKGEGAGTDAPRRLGVAGRCKGRGC